MATNSIIFANTRAYSAMSSFLTAEKYQRLMDCANSAELKKCLTEFSFEGESLDEMFSNAQNSIYSFLNECSPIECIRLSLLKKNDYHNAKVMAKCKYVRREITTDLLYENCAIDTKKMKEYILNDDYVLLPLPMAHALEQIDVSFARGERSGRVIDCLLTKAMYEDIFLTLGDKYREMIEIFQAEVDFANISVALRIKKMNLPIDILSQEMIEGGTLNKAQLTSIALGSEEEVVSALRGMQCNQLVAEGLKEISSPSFIDFERLSDNYILKKIIPYRSDTSNYMLFYGYILSKLYELKNVRIICGAVNAGIDKAQIKEKLRLQYVG